MRLEAPLSVLRTDASVLSTLPSSFVTAADECRIRSRLMPKLLRLESRHQHLLRQLNETLPVPEERWRERESVRPSVIALVANHTSFFTKELLVHGIPIRAHKDVSDGALYVAADRISRMLRAQPEQVLTRLRRRRASIHIVGRRQQVSDLPEHRALRGRRGDYASEAINDPRRMVAHGVWAERADNIRGYRLPLLSAEQLTVDERTRGLGGLQASVGEENLVSNDHDPKYAGRDIVTHEFAHTLMDYGLSQATRTAIEATYNHSVIREGLWRRPDGSPAYAATNAEEFFAELTMWYFGSHGEYVDTRRQLPSAGPAGLVWYDPHGFTLLGQIYGGTHTTLRADGDDAEDAVPVRLLPLQEAVGDSKRVSAEATDEAKAEGKEPNVEEAHCIIEVSAGAHALDLAWIDGDGKERPWGGVEPNGRTVQRTFSGHTWQVAHRGGGSTARYVVGRSPVQLIDAGEDLP